MSDDRNDLSNSLTTVLQNSPPPISQSQPASRRKPSRLFPWILKLVIGLSGIIGVWGMFWLGESVRVGLIAIGLGLAAAFSCFVWLDHLETQREAYRSQTDRVPYRDPYIDQVELDLMGPSSSYLSPASRHAPPQVEAIRAIKEVEISKMNLAAETDSQRLSSETTIKVTELTTRAQVDTARINAGATVESAKYTALGASGLLNNEKELIKLKDQLAADEAARAREHQSKESALDRDARSSAVMDKVEAEIKLLTARYNIDNPSTEEERKRKDFQFETTMDTLSKIATMSKTDASTAQMLLEKWQRGEL